MRVRYIEGLSPHVLCVSKSFAELNPVLPKKVIFHFGYWKKELEVIIEPKLTENELGLPRDISNRFMIPNDLSYELKIDGRNLHLGPVIAFVVTSTEERLKSYLLKKMEKYLRASSEVKGLVFVCATEGFDIQNRTIKGYYLTINELENDSPWRQAVFPYPGAVYRITEIRKSVYDSLIESIGNKIFNTYFFNKWELWDYLHPIPSVQSYLPYTEVFTTKDRLEQLLGKYDSLYLKRASGQRSSGILKVHRTIEGYHFSERFKKETIFDNQQELELFLQELNKKGHYLIQQAIPIKRYEGRNYDFRVILQKGYSGQWECTGVIARFGEKSGITSNFTQKGFALRGVDALKKIFQFNEQEAFQKEQEMIRACREVCEMLDQVIGHYGDVGIDVVVDENLKVWILEVNKLHDHRMPLYGLNDKSMYNNVIRNPFFYAKKLAGF